MLRILGAIVGVAALIAVISAAARADTIDTFTFTEGNWSGYRLVAGVDSPQLGDTLTGSFTGVVEPSGFIEQKDLTAFNVDFSDGSLFANLGLGDLTLFEYDINGGVSSLDFAGSLGAIQNICVGAATSLDANCTLDFEVAYPAGTVGVVEVASLPDFVSPAFPVITLQSSFTPLMPIPAPAPVATAPEPASAFLLLTGAALVFIGRFRRGQTPRRGQPRAAALLPLAIDWPNTTTGADQNHHSSPAHSGLEPSF